MAMRSAAINFDCKFLWIFFISAIVFYILVYPSSPGDITDVLNFTHRVRKNFKKALADSELRNKKIPLFSNFTESFRIANDYKLAHCAYPTIISSMMENMMCYLYDNELFASSGNMITGGWRTSGACKNRNEYNYYKDTVKHLPFGFNTTMLIREPLSRFFNAFMHICIYEPGLTRRENCFNCAKRSPNIMGCVLENLAKQLELGTSYVGDNRPFAYELSHMAPYTWFCNIRNIYDRTYFIQYNTESESANEISMKRILSILDFLGVERWKLKYISTEMQSRENTWSYTYRQLRTSGKLDFMNEIRTNQTLFNMLLNIYASDYAIFEYPIPSNDAPELFLL